MQVKKLYNSKRIFSISAFFFAGLIANVTSAFTLGDISLNSALNQPLVANIELLELDGLNEEQILVTLGSEADFERVGVEPLPLLNELNFEVEVISSSEGLIRISSADDIVEPYLNFVLNVRWPSGRVIRKYTVLLDLPTFTANPTPVTPPTPARTVPEQNRPTPPAPRVEPDPEPEPVMEMEETSAPEPSDETVVIQEGDSLWNIALATRPGNDISVQRMMLAIQRANSNSDAFIRNNINGIRSGRVLRIPSRQEINAITQEQAISQVAVQNQQFSNNAQPLAVNNSQGSSNNARDELSIVNSSDNEEEIAGLNVTIANLENDLMLSEENLDRALLENQVLNSRLADLEEEIAILENIIAIEGQRMSELQAQLAEQAETEAAEVLAVIPSQDATSQPVTEPPAPTPAPSPAPSGGLISNLLGSTIGMIGVLVVLLALVVGFLIARNRSAAGNDEDEFDAILAEEESEEESEIDAIIEEDSESESLISIDEHEEANDLDDFLEEKNEEEAEQVDLSEIEEKAEEIEEEIEEIEEIDQLEDLEEINEAVEEDIDPELEDSSDDSASEEFLEEIDESEDENEEPAKAGFLAGLLARFSRKKDDELEDEEESLFDDEESITDADLDEFLEDLDFDDEESESNESEENAEATESDSDVEFDLDLDGVNTKDEIDHINTLGEEPKSSKSEDASSSLVNLGLDDAIAFDENDEEELQIITDQDEVSTKLDLAVAYHAMEDLDGAKEILAEVMSEGNDDQKAEAQKLISEWGGL